MPTYPTLRERVESCLLAAGFQAYGQPIPTIRTGGTFGITSGVGVKVYVEWWDAPDTDKRALLEEFAAALRDARFVVRDRGEELYVTEPEKLSGEGE